MKLLVVLAVAILGVLDIGPAWAANSGPALSELRAGAMIDDVELHTGPAWIIPVVGLLDRRRSANQRFPPAHCRHRVGWGAALSLELLPWASPRRAQPP